VAAEHAIRSRHHRLRIVFCGQRNNDEGFSMISLAVKVWLFVLGQAESMAGQNYLPPDKIVQKYSRDSRENWPILLPTLTPHSLDNNESAVQESTKTPETCKTKQANRLLHFCDHAKL
jgi:hypothetical protein